jgi:hypothetical protein
MTDTSASLDTAASTCEFCMQHRARTVHIQIRDCGGRPVIDLHRHFATKAAERWLALAIGINTTCAAASDLFETDCTL